MHNNLLYYRNALQLALLSKGIAIGFSMEINSKGFFQYLRLMSRLNTVENPVYIRQLWTWMEFGFSNCLLSKSNLCYWKWQEQIKLSLNGFQKWQSKYHFRIMETFCLIIIIIIITGFLVTWGDLLSLKLLWKTIS